MVLLWQTYHLSIVWYWIKLELWQFQNLNLKCSISMNLSSLFLINHLRTIGKNIANNNKIIMKFNSFYKKILNLQLNKLPKLKLIHHQNIWLVVQNVLLLNQRNLKILILIVTQIIMIKLTLIQKKLLMIIQNWEIFIGANNLNYFKILGDQILRLIIMGMCNKFKIIVLNNPQIWKDKQ